MITVTHTKDLDYIESVLSSPGMARLCGAESATCSIHDAVVADGKTFLEVAKDGIKMGFVSLTKLDEGIAEIHVALKTRGSDTVEAILKCLEWAKNAGLKEIFAAFSPQRKAVLNLAKETGFVDAGHTIFNGEFMTIKKITI
jgi:hypothetical protein